MVEYRIYFASVGGLLSGIETEARCASDKEACALAQRILEGDDQAEVWGRHPVRRAGLGGPDGRDCGDRASVDCALR